MSPRNEAKQNVIVLEPIEITGESSEGAGQPFEIITHDPSLDEVLPDHLKQTTIGQAVCVCL